MISFANDSVIDLDVIRIMGVSVKESDNPIGYFGTGLKFAIATLLRTQHEVRLVCDGTAYDFGLKDQTIRGEEFSLVTMGDEVLPFTTALGRNWTPEMAYRELHSNCLDEGGKIFDGTPDRSFGTLFQVDGDGIRIAYAARHDVFLDGQPLHVGEDVEMYDGGGTAGYYRGVKAIGLGKQTLFRWNVVSDLELTEDRTIKNPYMFAHSVRRCITRMTDQRMLERLLLAPKDSWEGCLDFKYESFPSEAFKSVCARFRTDLRLNQSAYKLWVEKAAPDEIDQAQTTSLIEEDIAEALRLLRHLGCKLTREDFKIVESLGEGIFGVVRHGEIMIAMKTLDRGTRFIASTLYEEWIHKDQGLHDETRALQDHLLDKLMRFVAEFDRKERR